MKVSEIPIGEGQIGNVGGTDVAIYNDGNRLIVLANTCTHMGCQTNWNNTEKTWDCPCHGSRFRADGTVLNGPAVDPLLRLDYGVEGDEIRLT